MKPTDKINRINDSTIISPVRITRLKTSYGKESFQQSDMSNSCTQHCNLASKQFKTNFSDKGNALWRPGDELQDYFFLEKLMTIVISRFVGMSCFGEISQIFNQPFIQKPDN